MDTSLQPTLNRLDLLTSGKIIPVDGKIYWHIENFTQDMDKFEIIFTLEKMFKILQPYFVPVFTSTNNIRESQITLRFKHNGDDGLPERFDQGTLAYAYLANNTDSRGFISDVFFNDNYVWTEMHSDFSFNLLKVAIHEVLHACGLQHSDNPDDIMYWQYQGNGSIFISENTQESIFNLYGNVETTPVCDIKKHYAALFPSVNRLLKLTEAQILILAEDLDIEATIDDLKSDTAHKVVEVLRNET